MTLTIEKIEEILLKNLVDYCDLIDYCNDNYPEVEVMDIYISVFGIGHNNDMIFHKEFGDIIPMDWYRKDK